MAQKRSRLSGRVVHAAAELDGQRDVRRQGVAHAGDDLQRRGRLAQQIAAAAAAEDLLHRAGEVQVDHVEAGGDQFAGGQGELLRVVAHQLRTAGVVVVADAEEPPRLRPLGHVDDELVQEDFAERVRGAQSPGDPPHRPVGVAAQRRLHGGKVDDDRDQDGAERAHSVRWRAEENGADEPPILPASRSSHQPATLSLRERGLRHFKPKRA